MTHHDVSLSQRKNEKKNTKQKKKLTKKEKNPRKSHDEIIIKRKTMKGTTQNIE